MSKKLWDNQKAAKTKLLGGGGLSSNKGFSQTVASELKWQMKFKDRLGRNYIRKGYQWGPSPTKEKIEGVRGRWRSIRKVMFWGGDKLSSGSPLKKRTGRSLFDLQKVLSLRERAFVKRKNRAAQVQDSRVGLSPLKGTEGEKRGGRPSNRSWSLILRGTCQWFLTGGAGDSVSFRLSSVYLTTKP